MCTLGKALSGGFFPVSAVIGMNNVLNDFIEFDEGDIYAGNPLGCKIMMESIRVIREDGMLENCQKQG